MIKRFRLEKKSEYEKLVIAQRLSDMLDKFLDGRRAPNEIGAEKGGIKEWDDVVVGHSAESYEHLQIKRQTIDFCTKDADKQKYLDKAAKRKKNSKGASKKASTNNKTKANISVLDSAFTSLANYAKSDSFKELPQRQFQLTLLGGNLRIKNKLTINHLDEVCNLCRQDGLNIQELSERKDGPTSNTYLWLTTWCGFENWTQIRDTLRRVSVVCVGNDETLRQRSLESLGRHFTNPEETLNQLLTYITAESSDVASLRCHDVIQKLKNGLRPDFVTWAQYLLSDAGQPTGSNWSFTGTHDLRGTANSSPNELVQHMWSSEPGNRKLRVYAQYIPAGGSNLTLQAAILRLALHLQQGSQGLLLGEPTWRNGTGPEVGYTFGSQASDLKHLSWMENPESLTCLPDSEFKTIAASREEAESLSQAMDDVVWKQLVEAMTVKLESVKDLDLANAMEVIWNAWLISFESDHEDRRRFLEQLLYPMTEGKNVNHALRLGPRTLDLLSTAIETLLLVAVGTGGSTPNWASFPNHGEVLTIALSFWSGPSDSPPEVRELSDDPLMAIIGPSPAPIVILSGVGESPTVMSNVGMADDSDMTTSMAVERKPNLLVTKSGTRKHLREGTLATVKQHFNKHSQELSLARQSAIEKNSKGI